MYVEAYRFYPKTEVGRNTIDHVALNNRKEFANRRGEECQYLERAFLNWSRAMAGGHDDQHWVCEAKTKLSSCDERSAYSAVIATYILIIRVGGLRATEGDSEGARILGFGLRPD